MVASGVVLACCVEKNERVSEGRAFCVDGIRSWSVENHEEDEEATGCSARVGVTMGVDAIGGAGVGGDSLCQ